MVTSQGENRGNGKNKGYIFLRVMGNRYERKQHLTACMERKRSSVIQSGTDAISTDFFIKGLTGYPQTISGQALIPTTFFKGFFNQFLLHLLDFNPLFWDISNDAPSL